MVDIWWELQRESNWHISLYCGRPAIAEGASGKQPGCRSQIHVVAKEPVLHTTVSHIRGAYSSQIPCVKAVPDGSSALLLQERNHCRSKKASVCFCSHQRCFASLCRRWLPEPEFMTSSTAWASLSLKTPGTRRWLGCGAAGNSRTSTRCLFGESSSEGPPLWNAQTELCFSEENAVTLT